MQVVPQPFLQTVEVTGGGVRESYPSDGSSIVPFVRMAYTNTGGNLTEQGYQLGIFLVKAHYTVRGRRATPLDMAIVAARMLPSDQVKMLETLLEIVEHNKPKVLPSSKAVLKPR